MRPRPDRNKIKKVLHYKDTELWQGIGYGRGPTFEVPGGAGVSNSWWKKNIKEEQQTKTYQFDKRIEQLVKRYNNIRRKGVDNHNIVLAPLQDNSKG